MNRVYTGTILPSPLPCYHPHTHTEGLHLLGLDGEDLKSEAEGSG